MACSIKRDSNNNITEVLAPNGQKSKLFEEIQTNVFIGTNDLAANVLTSSYTDSMEKLFQDAENNVYDTKEPKVFYQDSKGEVFEDIESLILDGQKGPVTIGFKHPKNDIFLPKAKFDISKGTMNSFIVSQIEQGFLSPKKVVKEDNSTRLKGKGNFRTTQKTMAKGFMFEAMVEMGMGNVYVNKDGEIEMPAPKDYVVGIREDGTIEVFRDADIPQKIKDNNFINSYSLISRYKAKFINPRPLKVGQKKDSNPEEVNNIKASLFSFLERMGFSTTTLEEYRKNYKTKYGKDPDINAIADLANKVVALSEGRDITDDLTEEVAHIAIASYNEQNSIITALANVHLTQEYKEYSEYYRDLYGKQKDENGNPIYQGDKLEDQVRKEVLGKVLAREIKEQFLEQGKTEEKVTLTQKLRNLWNTFTNWLLGRSSDYNRQVINDLNRKIAQSILNDNITDFNVDFSSLDFFYNATEEDPANLDSELQALRRTLTDLHTQILNKPVPNQSKLDKIHDDMTTSDILSALSTIIATANTLENQVAKNIEESEKNNELFSTTDSITLLALDSNIMPLLRSAREKLDKIDYKGDALIKKKIKDTIKSIDEVDYKHSRVTPKMEIDNKAYVRQLVEEKIEGRSLTEEEKNQVLAQVEGGMVDLTFFSSTFGLATNMNNALIGLATAKAQELYDTANEETISVANPIIRNIYERGLQKYQQNIVMKTSDGKNSYYYISPINWVKYDEDLEAERVKILAEILEVDPKEIKKRRDNKETVKEILNNDSKLTEFRDKFSEAKKALREKPMTEEYERQKKEVYDRAGLSDYTRTVLKNMSSRRFAENRKFRKPDGTIDKSSQTEGERIAELDMLREFRQFRDAYDEYGNLKEGLRVVKYTELTQEEKDALPYKVDSGYTGDIITLAEGMTKENLLDDSRLALDMSNLNMIYREMLRTEEKSSNASLAFKEKLLEQERKFGNSSSWMLSNSSIGLNDRFYETLGETETFDARVKRFVDRIEDPSEKRQKQDLLDEYTELQRKRKALLRQNRDNKEKINTDAYNMSGRTRKAIREIENEIIITRRALELPKEFFEEEFEMAQTVRVLTDDFYMMLEESGETLFDFALEHMPEEKKRRVREFGYQVEDIIRGKRSRIKPGFESFIDDMYTSGKLRDKTNNEIIQILKDEYAKANVSSYFQRFEPVGYTTVINDIKSGKIKASDLFDQTKKESLIEKYPALEFIEITPDYTWLQDVNKAEFVNKNYKKDGYYEKPLLSKYLNDEFFERYGIKKEDYINSETSGIEGLVATKNKEEFDLLKQMILLNEMTIENHKDVGSVNPYMRPQMSLTQLEKITGLASTKAISTTKDAINDLLTNRVDEKTYGEQIEGLGNLSEELDIKIIPKYFQQKLKTQEEQSNNIIQAALLNFKQSNIYKERVRLERDLIAIQYQISQQRFKKRGGVSGRLKISKKAQASNYLKFIQQFNDYHLYGITQSLNMTTSVLGQKVDFTSVINAFQGFVRFSNLAFNPIVDATSAATGVLTNFTDRLAKDLYSTDSANRAFSVTSKLMGDYIKESGVVDKKSKIFLLTEHFGLSDFRTKIENSSFSRTMRFLGRSAFSLSKLANVPITQRNLVLTLMDTRFVDGKFMDFNEFKRKMMLEDESISRKGIESRWKKYAKDSLYDNIEITDRAVKYNSKFADKFKNPQEEFKKISREISRRTRQINERADGVINEIDQTMAQRNVLLNTVMMHSGWLPILLTKRFKGRQYNFDLNKFEEGHYTSLFGLIGEYISGIRKNDYKGIREVFKGLKEDQKTNVRRSVYEFGLMGVLLLLGELIFSLDDGDDDEDNTFVEDFAKYTYLRTVSEYNTTTLFGMPRELIAKAKSPLVAIRTIEAIEPISLTTSLFYVDEETGEWEFYKKLRKNTILKRKQQLGDLDKQINSYKHFNQKTLFNLSD